MRRYCGKRHSEDSKIFSSDRTEIFYNFVYEIQENASIAKADEMVPMHDGSLFPGSMS